ncbi:protocadherin-11 X-linked isoform c precursor [Mus musculus]|uniref:Protocadherin 11 X-linked n=1 Tax=Mus musculus TaxID=10090 RepID=F6ZNL5_MOUSE|nr:protocadherin-11 X-linked isoform c precursor [Mus musculus]NP_001390564.1 protocadherin-11 X-linked isoform c precursor [Mus musculus]|eukprot:XP_006528453.1 PREDICTED: protocadherin-11 X-linked isoform X5 [Mus musculus]
MDLLSGTYIFAVLLACVVFQSGAQEKNYTVREEMPENVLIGDLLKDLNLSLIPDKSLTTPMQFKLVYKTGDVPLIRIEEGTGEIFTTGARIDREKLCAGIVLDARCFYEVEVAVLPDEIFRLVKIRFLIEDINDNAPLFPTTVINISIPENSAINSRYSLPAAIDPDIGINGVQNYQLIKSQNIFGLDVIETPEGDKMPQLIVQKELDREEKDTYVMKVKVEDGGFPQRSSTAILQVSVADTNDNHPIFIEKEIEVSIPENAPIGSSVTQLHATDADIGENARIHFYFSNLVSNIAKRLFHLNTTTGLITVKEPLDREESPSHKLLVLATDGGSTPARATVLVNVTDINDNVPSIDIRYIVNPTNGTVLLSENAPLNTKIALITVMDKDSEHNGRVTCFTDHEVPFRLRPVFSNQFLLETAAFLDFESTREYAIKLLAADAGKPPLNQSSMLLIKVKDENDNAPVFTQSFISLSVPENNSPGAQLTKISATDADSGQNAEISYMLGFDAPPEFNLDQRTGILTAVKKLDREKQEKYYFTVLAQDNGIPPLMSNATVFVTVLDQNDNSPIFTHNEYNFYVPESLPKHGTVGLITVTDPDYGENSAVTLSILDVNDQFTIDPQSGVIRPNISFDRERQESYTFYVKAEDGGRVSRSSTARVTINVVDVNDNKPIFIDPPSNYSFEWVLPSTNPGTVVFKVVAIDDDIGMNAEVLYSIVGGNTKGLFMIEQTSGNITLKEKCMVSDLGLHRVIVKANDLGQPDSLFNVVNVNFFINESVPNATLIYELVRRSIDAPANQNTETTSASSPTTDYVKIMVAIVAGTITVVLVIFITAVVRCRQPPHLKASQKNKQNSEWVTPNPENRQMIMMKKKKKKKKKHPPKNLLLNFVTIEEAKPDDGENERNSVTLDLPIELEEQTMGKYNWGTTPTTFKPDSPDLARHYKSASPQPAFQIQPETPLNSKHHIIQELPLDNTFVGCDSISKCSSSSSDPYSVSECSYPVTTFKAPVSVHIRPTMKEVVRSHTPMKEATTVEIWTHPHPQRRSDGKKAGKSQRRVTFHLPEGSQESISDGGLGDHDAGSLPSTSHALPLGYPQEEYFDHAAPNNRTEGDGNSDPESTFIPGLKKAAEITVQPTVEEASDTCTQECLILGHSDSCWMPATLTNPSPSQIKTSAICHSPPRPRLSVRRYSPPVTQTVTICHSPPVTQAIALCHSPPPVQVTVPRHSPPPAQASAVSYSPTLVQAVVIHHSPPLPQAATHHRTQAQPPMGLQQGWVQGAGADGLYPIDQGVQGSTRAQFYTMAERFHPDDDSIKVIPLTTFTSGQQARSSRGDSPIIEEHPL